MLKIKSEDRVELKAAVQSVLLAHDLRRPVYPVPKRMRWSIFHCACATNPGLLGRLYAYMNDSHVDSALRVIFRELSKGES